MICQKIVPRHQDSKAPRIVLTEGPDPEKFES